jgi:hypothetical protein
VSDLRTIVTLTNSNLLSEHNFRNLRYLCIRLFDPFVACFALTLSCGMLREL